VRCERKVLIAEQSGAGTEREAAAHGAVCAEQRAQAILHGAIRARKQDAKC
jgi:hypothetical protein